MLKEKEREKTGNRRKENENEECITEGKDEKFTFSRGMKKKEKKERKD